MFARRNQIHSCAQRSVEHHLESANEQTRALYEKLLARVHELGPVSLSIVKSQITMKARRGFLGVKVRPDRLVVELALPKRVEDDRFSRVTKLSASSYAHVTELSGPDAMDETFDGYLKDAYEVGSR